MSTAATVNARRTGPAPRPRRDGEAAPLSPLQEHVWQLAEAAPEAPFFTMSEALRLQGPLDVDALAAAIDAVVARHDVLRSVFVDGGMVAVPPEELQRPVAGVVDLRGLGRDAAHARAVELACGDALRAVDLRRAPNLRASIVRIADDDAALLLATSHVVADGWSVGVIAREIAMLYGRGPGALAPLPLQYADVARWHHEVMEERAPAELAYWLERLRPPLPPLALPGWSAGPPTWRVERHAVVTSAPVRDAMHDACRAARATPFMFLAAALASALSQWTGVDDVRIATNLAGREHPSTDDVVGLFVNAVVLRVDCSGAPTFGELLRRVRDATIDAFDHACVPFASVAHAVEESYGVARDQLFTTMLLMQTLPPFDLALDGVRVTPLLPRNALQRPSAAQLDLVVELRDTPSGIGGSVQYCIDRCARSDVARFVHSVQRAIAAGVR